MWQHNSDITVRNGIKYLLLVADWIPALNCLLWYPWSIKLVDWRIILVEPILHYSTLHLMCSYWAFRGVFRNVGFVSLSMPQRFPLIMWTYFSWSLGICYWTTMRDKYVTSFSDWNYFLLLFFLHIFRFDVLLYLVVINWWIRHSFIEHFLMIASIGIVQRLFEFNTWRSFTVTLEWFHFQKLCEFISILNDWVQVCRYNSPRLFTWISFMLLSHTTMSVS